MRRKFNSLRAILKKLIEAQKFADKLAIHVCIFLKFSTPQNPEFVSIHYLYATKCLRMW